MGEVVPFRVPATLAAKCRASEEATAWLSRVPATVDALAARWDLSVGDPFESGAAWVAAATRDDGGDCVLKLGMPHMEGRDEIAGLRFWDSAPTVRLLEADDSLNAMLLERCMPGHSLRTRPEVEQDVVITELLRGLWQAPPPEAGFRSLSIMLDDWEQEAMQSEAASRDPALFRAGLDVYRKFSRDGSPQVLLATDLHAGNVLSARREPWLAIDPKPFVGDPTYDLTQHLLNCGERLHADPLAVTDTVAGMAGVDARRLRSWTFARIVVNPWSVDDRWQVTARTLAP